MNYFQYYIFYKEVLEDHLSILLFRCVLHDVDCAISSLLFFVAA